MIDVKIKVLAEFLGVEPREIELCDYDENMFFNYDEEYLVFTDEEANQEYYDYQMETIEDMGLNAFSEWFQNNILNNYADLSWFDECKQESYECYIENIRGEYGRLEEEMEDANCDNEDEFCEYLCNQWSDSVEWYKMNFGNDDYSQAVKDNCNIDWDSVIDECKDIDGRECVLASYDGCENEIYCEDETYYIYRRN